MFRQRWVLQAACGAAAFSASIAVFSLVMETHKEVEDENVDASTSEGSPLLGNRDPSTTISTVSMTTLNNALNAMHLSIVQRVRVQSFWDELSSTVSVEAIPVPDAVGHMEVYAQRYPHEFPLPQLLHALSVVTNTNPSMLTSQISSNSSNASPPVVRRRSTLSLVGNKLFEMAVDTKGGMQDAMHRAVRRYLERALDLFAEKLKEAIKDKDMPVYLQANIDVAVDQFLPDIKVELSRKTKDLFVATTHVASATAVTSFPRLSDHPQTLADRLHERWHRSRAVILYNLFPFDQSIWRCFKNPMWWALNLIGLLPYIGQAWWCYLFFLKDKKNEHQLCQFIIGFKTTQFLTLGLGATFLGIIRFIYCTTHGQQSCHDYGPLLSPWNTVFFLGQIALVWIAFFYLPYTERPVSTAPLSPRGSLSSRHAATYQDMFGNVLHIDRGGYLMKLCGYETITFCITMALALAVNVVVVPTWERQMLMFWIRTLYGLLSFPFLPFKIPVLENVLMHTVRMGYDSHGRTVRMRSAVSVDVPASPPPSG
ncbi:hypothetical protein H310_03080 [Aphanomyces invadans]|uniref:Uncharacterized protein n=1 Tax=Aphanomyces invadans TaxID=157072 RepID=A0A024UN02_9STRA|nr:hypothetical protein H310_03080 [Aphanomyces invadans]ETW06978.1 hypothetical protein H310_03080 [Aphanomyces invadans]|eukprot:XP_008865053.1 hypothetical protein H310_03080 [Aphanomyces invadans]